MVEAFNEIIDNKVLFIEEGTRTNIVMTHNFLGRFNGKTRNTETPFCVPSRIEFGEQDISLIVDETKNHEGGSINVHKLGNDEYQVGYVECEYSHASYNDFIKPLVVSKDTLLDDLARIAATYKEVRTLYEKDEYKFLFDAEYRSNIPQFP